MNSILRKTIAVAFTLFVFLIMYMGAYLPLRKAQIYIATRTRPVNSLKEFDSVFNAALDFYSPVGQDELVSNFLEIIIGALNSDKTNEASTIHELVKRAELRASPIVSRGVGFGLSQITNGLGTTYEIAAFKLQDKTYYDKAVKTMNLGLTYSPNRKLFLSTLLNLYGLSGDIPNAKKIAENVLKYWPNDAQALQVLQQIADFENKPVGK